MTLFATLPTSERQRLLDLFPGQGFDKPTEMSAIYYALSPFGFGGQAYRHFLKLGNGAAFIAKILAGELLDHEESE